MLIQQRKKKNNLEKADRTTAYMFETMIEANRKAEEKEEKESEGRIRRQDELLQRQYEYLRHQEVCEE